MDFRACPALSREQIVSLLDLAREAAGRILSHYQERGEAPEGHLSHSQKADSTPLTEADLASHQILGEGLQALTPEIPLLSEESDARDIRDRHSWTRFWLVDPLDGTREFLERTGHFTINIALIDEHRPVLGLLYEPIADCASLGIVGQGAWRLRHDGRDWQADSLATRPLPGDTLTLLASRRHRNPKLAATIDFLTSRRHLERRNSGSALKFCDLAGGLADCYPRFSPCSEWDVAAGDALLRSAGGCVFGLDGQPLRYNARDTLLSEHFLAVGDPTSALWPQLLEALR